MQNKFQTAITQICEEKNIPKEIVLETVEAALVAAYKKDYGNKDQEIRVVLEEDTGKPEVFISKEVVSEVENPYLQISLEEAKKIKKGAKVGGKVEIKDTPSDFGRIAAQTAKQVIIQRIREAERDITFSEYKDKEGELLNGVVQRIEDNNVLVDLGRAVGIMFPSEQISGERYYIGQRIKVYVVKVEQTTKGPQIVVSRSHPGIIKRLFEMEVPEIVAKTVEIKAIARESGQRTKLAVWSNAEGIDPVGSCVGQRGVRVQAVMAEIGEEKIDIILWDQDSKVFIINALSPAKVVSIDLFEKEKKAKVRVPEDQLSLAIGKQGQNVRLAAKLTGWNIDIVGGDEAGVEATAKAVEDEGKRDIEEEIIKAVEEKTTEEKVTEKKSKEIEEDKLEPEKSPKTKTQRSKVEVEKTEQKEETSVEASKSEPGVEVEKVKTDLPQLKTKEKPDQSSSGGKKTKTEKSK